MEYVRLVHPKHWDAERQKFSDLAFKKSSDSGLSLVCKACAEAASGGLICAHFRKFYPTVTGEPPVFVVVTTEELPVGHEVIETPSDTNDHCHREVIEAKEKPLKKLFARKPVSAFLICDDVTGIRPIEEKDWKGWPTLAA